MQQVSLGKLKAMYVSKSIAAATAGADSITGLGFEPKAIIANFGNSGSQGAGQNVMYNNGAGQMIGGGFEFIQSDVNAADPLDANSLFRKSNNANNQYQQTSNVVTPDSDGITFTNTTLGGGFNLAINLLFLG